MRTAPGGRNPLSRSSSHSWPSVQLHPPVNVAVCPAASDATLVFRQKRSLPSAAGTVIASYSGPLTMKIVPVRPFSGRPPSAGGENLGSRQVPVHVGGSAGSIGAPALVSLYVTSVR